MKPLRMQLHRQRVYSDDQYRERICEWLRANDIDPADVPIEERPTIAGDQMTLIVMSRNADGRHYYDPLSPDRLAKETITVKLKVPLPEAIRDWAVSA